jgi:DNA-binding beta-propeller fold protein YncE
MNLSAVVVKTLAQQPGQVYSIEPAIHERSPIFHVPKGGIGFDDLWFSPDLRAVIAPAGGTGCVDLFDSSSLARTSLCGIGPGSAYAGGHGEGTTSADVGAGFVFAVDRTSQSLQVIDPKTKSILTSTPLAGGPDYVRWVGSQRELWVTEPAQEKIEVFSLASDNPLKFSKGGAIAVKGGPESLVIDERHGRAFTHLWQGATVQIDLATRAVGEPFSNGCKGSRGIALDAERGQLFVGCSEGKAVVIDVDHGARVLDALGTPSGVDIISTNLSLHHLYVPASSDGRVAVLGVSSKGKLSKLGDFQADNGTHCATSDDHGRVWVCAPDSGTLLVFDDTFQATTQ